MKTRSHIAMTPYYFVFPSILILAALMVFPIAKVFQYSVFANYILHRAHPNFVGSDNFLWLVQNHAFWVAARNTAVFTVASVAGHVVVGMILALLLNQMAGAVSRAIFRSALLLPWIFTAVIVAVNWQLIVNPEGILNFALRSLGIIRGPTDWLGSNRFALATLVAVNIWRGYPFLMISFLAGLQGIPNDLYEASRIDGANSFQSFWAITVPQLRPVLVSVGLLDTIWTFRLFPLVWLLTGGGPGDSTETISTFTFRTAFINFEYGKASAVAFVLLLITVGLAIGYLALQSDNQS